MLGGAITETRSLKGHGNDEETDQRALNALMRIGNTSNVLFWSMTAKELLNNSQLFRNRSIIFPLVGPAIGFARPPESRPMKASTSSATTGTACSTQRRHPAGPKSFRQVLGNSPGRHRSQPELFMALVSAGCAGLNALEVAGALPVGHGVVEGLDFQAGGVGVEVDHGVAERLAGQDAALQEVGGVAEGSGER